MHNTFRLSVAACCAILPWPIRRWGLRTLLGYKIDQGAFVGHALVLCDKVHLREGGYIGHFTVIKNLESLEMGERAAIGQFNWISGYKKSAKDPSFYDEPDRRSTLVMENFAVITNRHIIDCTNSVSLGCYSTFAGYNSQIITHGIDVSTSRQRSAPVVIGAYCLVGTRCLLLNGTQLPDYCLLGAGSVLTKAYKETYSLYAGSPAKKIKNLDPECLYFHRKTGFVV